MHVDHLSANKYHSVLTSATWQQRLERWKNPTGGGKNATNPGVFFLNLLKRW